VGTKSFTLNGLVLNSNTPNANIKINLKIQCDPVWINPDPSDTILVSPTFLTKDYTYTVGQDLLKIPYKNFQTFYQCNSPVVYSVTLEGNAKLPGFINPKQDYNSG
jgi:hypothetical protein